MGLGENYYTKNYSTFDEWFELVLNEKKVYPRFRIPYNEWLDEYIKDIENKSVEEVKDLIRCLLMPINRGLDLMEYESYLTTKNSDNEGIVRESKRYYTERCRRIEKGNSAWEGLTWVLDLLPYHPYKAIEALGSYLSAQILSLPDDRIEGIEQCGEIIMSKFIYFENEMKKIMNLKPVEFEWLIEKLYNYMGYDTVWTPATRDGGKDVIATIKRSDGYEKVYIECKLYKTTKLEKGTVRALGYTLGEDKVNRGVIFCTGYVSDEIKNMDKRIQIWTYAGINILLNAHMGSDWPERLDKIIDKQRTKYRPCLPQR